MAEYNIDKSLIPPHDLDAEKSVLGALLLDKDAIVKVIEFLKETHFYKISHAKIYEAIVNLFEKREPADLVTVPQELKKMKELEKIGGVSYLTELVNSVPTAANIEAYANIIRDTAIKRAILSASAEIGELVFDEPDTNNLIDRAEQIFYSVAKDKVHQDFVPVRETLEVTFERLDELSKTRGSLRGVATGLKTLDKMTSGLQTGDLIILAARPSVGKSSLAINIAQAAAVNYSIGVGLFSLEMGKESIVDRMIAAQGDIDNWRITTGNLEPEDFEKYGVAAGELSESPIFIDDTPGQSVLEMRTKARRLMLEHPIGLIIVDYLQLMRGRRQESRVQEVSEISQGLKNLARELKVPVLALSQLSRAVEQRGGEKRPQLSDLRDSGCLLGDTLITLDSGERVQIKDLVGKSNFEVLSLDSEMKVVPANASKVFPSGSKEVFCLTLASGKKIYASGNHPFLTITGWIRLDSLKVGDAVGTPNHIKIDKVGSSLSNNKIILLAHLLGDGCFVERQPLHYTNSEMELITIVSAAASAEFSIKPRIVNQKNWYHLYLSAEEKLTKGKRNPIVKWLDEDLKIYGLRSGEKYVPEVVFTLSENQIALFLKHLWATDGCIYIRKANKKGRMVSVQYASSSFRLATDVSHLLLRLGIISSLKTTSKKGYGGMYTVIIQDKENIEKFMKTVGCVGAKAKKIEEALALLSKIESNPNNNVIPKEIWKYIEQSRKFSGYSARNFFEKMGWAYSGSSKHKNGISRNRLAKIAELLPDKRLLDLANSDIYWDKIKSIESIGIKDVYDMTVPGNSNFVANDIIVHNSIEQDADIVMFLYRPDEEDRENYKLLIAKHRNGPTGELDLYFKADRTKFFEVSAAQREEE